MSKLDFSRVFRKLKIVSDKTLNNAEKVMDYTMSDAESHGKRTAPWTDRTGNARRSISGKTWQKSGIIIGGLGIGVDYGVYLELSYLGRYRVIKPTIDITKVKFMQNIKDIL